MSVEELLARPYLQPVRVDEAKEPAPIATPPVSTDGTKLYLKPQRGVEPAGTEICKYGCTHTFRKEHIPGYPDVDNPKEQTFEPNGSFKFPKPIFGRPLLKRF